MSPVVVVAVVAVVGFFVLLHVREMGNVSFTFDEQSDLEIVACIQDAGPFDCLADISQTRLPFLIHAIAGPAWGAEWRHYAVSMLFSLATLAMVYALAREIYRGDAHGRAVATLASALYVTSIPLLASGRMLLSHSNIVFTFFSTASFAAMVLHATRRSGWWIAASAVAFGASAASHPIGLLNAIALVPMYGVAGRMQWRHLAAVPAAAAAFFASSVIYVRPSNFADLVDAAQHPAPFPYWNYFGTGSATSPWWFPLLVFLVKIGPWWLLVTAACTIVAARRRSSRPADAVLAAFVGGFAVNLLAKGFVFEYEAPHHQVQWYPLLLVAFAAVIARAWSRPVAVAVTLAFAVQVWDVARFTPHYLFYGAQYGDRFIGEFYGPAVLHRQGLDVVNREIDRIFAADPEARLLVADNNLLRRGDSRIVAFTERDDMTTYDYAFVDRLYGTHFDFPERDAYNDLLAREYRVEFTESFPPDVWVYRLLRHR